MEYQLYINGEWKDTVMGYVAEDKSPADDSVFARVHFAGGAEVEEAIAAAQRAWRPWADTPAAQKEQILLKAADWLQGLLPLISHCYWLLKRWPLPWQQAIPLCSNQPAQRLFPV